MNYKICSKNRDNKVSLFKTTLIGKIKYLRQNLQKSKNKEAKFPCKKMRQFFLKKIILNQHKRGKSK